MKRRVLGVVLLLLLIPAACFGGRRDPLTDQEADQLRETNQEPLNRLKLLVQFAKARLVAVDQLRVDPKLAEGRGQRIHDLLEDFTAIIEELDDNLDMYSRQRHDDIRKALKTIVEADTDFQLRLRTLKAAPVAPEEARAYDFALQDALDVVNSNAENVRDIMRDQEAAAGASKQEKRR